MYFSQCWCEWTLWPGTSCLWKWVWRGSRKRLTCTGTHRDQLRATPGSSGPGPSAIRLRRCHAQCQCPTSMAKRIKKANMAVGPIWNLNKHSCTASLSWTHDTNWNLIGEQSVIMMRIDWSLALVTWSRDMSALKSEVIELKLMSLKTEDWWQCRENILGYQAKNSDRVTKPDRAWQMPIAGLKTKSNPIITKKHLKFDHMTYVAKNSLEVEAGDWRWTSRNLNANILIHNEYPLKPLIVK